MRGCRIAMLAGCLLLGTLAGDARLPAADAEVIRAGKAATALVDLGQEGSGSAFCIRADGVFVTNQHVVGARSVGEDVTLILNPASDEQQPVEARILKMDPQRDLALLKIADAEEMPVVELGTDEALVETQEVIVFGYPFGRMLSANGSDAPSITINAGRVSALRRRGRDLGLIQIDAKVNPGNSGGPVLDESGQVIGVVVSSILGSGVSFAVPVNQLTKFLDEPGLRIRSSKIPFGERFEPQTLDIDVFEFRKSDERLTIEATMILPGDENQTVAAKATADGYSVTLQPFVREDGGANLELFALHNGNVYACNTPNVAFQVGGRTFQLEEIFQIEARPELSIVSTIDHTKYAGKVQGLPPLKDRDTGEAVPLSEAERIQIYASSDTSSHVPLEVIARRGDETLARVDHLLELDAAPQVISEFEYETVGSLPGMWRRSAPGRRIMKTFLANDLAEVTWRDLPDDRLLTDAFVLGTFPLEHNETDVLNALGRFEVNGDWRGHSLTPRKPREEGTGRFNGPLTPERAQYYMFLIRMTERGQVSWNAQVDTSYDQNDVDLFVDFSPVDAQGEMTLPAGVHVFVLRQNHNKTDRFERSWASLSLFGSGLEVGSVPPQQPPANSLLTSYQKSGGFDVDWQPLEGAHPQHCLQIGPFPYDFDNQRLLEFIARGDIEADLQGSRLRPATAADQKFPGPTTPQSVMYYVFLVRTKSDQTVTSQFATYWEYQHSWLEVFVDFRPIDWYDKQIPLRAGEHVIIVCQHHYRSEQPKFSWIQFAIEGADIEVGRPSE